MNASAPTPERQLAFLAKLQRLFSEGDFTATYKYALLIALADLAVELGRDDDEPLRLANQSIAAKFIELYWQQAAPYSSAGSGRVRASRGAAWAPSPMNSISTSVPLI